MPEEDFNSEIVPPNLVRFREMRASAVAKDSELLELVEDNFTRVERVLSLRGDSLDKEREEIKKRIKEHVDKGNLSGSLVVDMWALRPEEMSHLMGDQQYQSFISALGKERAMVN